MSCKLELQQSLGEISPAVCSTSVFTCWCIVEVPVYLFCWGWELFLCCLSGDHGAAEPCHDNAIILYWLCQIHSSREMLCVHRLSSKSSLGEQDLTPLLPQENLGAFLMLETDLDWVLSLVSLKGTASSMGWMRWHSEAPSDLNYSVIPGIWSSEKFSPLGFPEASSDGAGWQDKFAAGKAANNTKRKNQGSGGQKQQERFPAVPIFPCFCGQQPAAEVGKVGGYERQTEYGKICRMLLILPSPLTMVLHTETHTGGA